MIDTVRVLIKPVTTSLFKIFGSKVDPISSLTYWFYREDIKFDKFLYCKINKRLLKKVIKSKWWMPWLSEAMKDVTSCEKLRGGANIRYIRRCPNGATLQAEGLELRRKSESKPGELKHLSTRRKIKQ